MKLKRCGITLSQTIFLITVCGFFVLQRHSLQSRRAQTCNQELGTWNCSEADRRDPSVSHVTVSTTLNPSSWQVLQHEDEPAVSTVYDGISFDGKKRQGSEELLDPAGSTEAVTESFVSLPAELSFHESNVSGYQPADNNPFSNHRASELVDAVVSMDKSLISLSCGGLNATRYNHLKPAFVREASITPRYFFALDLHQSAGILPRLLRSIIDVMCFLGPRSCILSITEGRSTDGTFEALSALKPVMEELGVDYSLKQSHLDPLAADADRIQALANLRNMALYPLMDHPGTFDPKTVIIFINDVSLCAEDILELLHQRVYQSADMTCAMDWINDGSLFYDVWIGRQMNGESFFEIPQSGSWEFAENLFWNDPPARARLDRGQPIQVFSCWNGATVFTAQPVMEHKIRFRSARQDECRLGEPTHFAKDMWTEGYKKIAIVPTVNIGYSDQQSRLAKERHGSVSTWVEKEDFSRNLIVWDEEPPRKIKCFPSWETPSMVQWDQ